jgi:hypothetical protein
VRPGCRSDDKSEPERCALSDRAGALPERCALSDGFND